MKWIVAAFSAFILSLSLTAHAENELSPLAQELLPVVKESLPQLTYGSSYPAMSAFVDALVNEEAPERVARLAIELKAGTDTSAQFLINVLEKIEGDPEKLERFERALQEARKQVTLGVIPKTPLGSRIVPFTSFGMGLMGLTYGYWSGYLGSAANTVITEHATFISVSLAGAIIGAGFNEIRVLIATLKNIKAPVQKYFEGRRVLKDLSKQLADYKKSGLGALTKAHVEAVKDNALKEKYALQIQKNAEELQNKYAELSAWHISAKLRKFLEQRALQKEVRNFSDSLTEKEKAWLKNDILNKAPALAEQVSLSAKLRLFEARTQGLFEQWLKEGGEAQNLRQVIQQMQAENLQARMDLYRPRLSTRITMWSISTGIALMGLVFTVGPESTVLDPIFSQTAVEWVRGKAWLFREVSALLIVGSLGYQMLDNMMLVKHRRQFKGPLGETQEFNSLLKVLDRVDQNIQRNAEGIPAESAEELIEKLLQAPENSLGARSCSAVFN